MPTNALDVSSSLASDYVPPAAALVQGMTEAMTEFGAAHLMANQAWQLLLASFDKTKAACSISPEKAHELAAIMFNHAYNAELVRKRTAAAAKRSDLPDVFRAISEHSKIVDALLSAGAVGVTR